MLKWSLVEILLHILQKVKRSKCDYTRLWKRSMQCFLNENRVKHLGAGGGVMKVKAECAYKVTIHEMLDFKNLVFL